MSQVKIIPTVLAYTNEEFTNKLSRVKGIVERVQIDIVGKAFSEDITVGIEVLQEISSSAAIDVQLMVKEPITFVNRCDLGGAQRVFGHIEYMRNQEEFVDYVATLGMEVGLAIDLETEVSELEGLIDSIDSVLVMSVPAGKSGQEFDGRVINKIRKVREMHNQVSICVDGGINDKNIKKCFDAGANEFAVGNYLWESKDIKVAIKKLMKAIL